MSWFRKVRERKKVDQEAMAHSQALLEEVVTSEQEMADRHACAMRELARATEQAKKLKAMDTQNHYSESLTHAFRGKPA